MKVAIQTIVKFNLVLIMEWLAYASPLVTSTLGFQNTSPLSTRVRPHISQYAREDGQEKNIGASGIGKASWVAEDYLPPDLYKVMSEDLALDAILTDVARRLFL